MKKITISILLVLLISCTSDKKQSRHADEKGKVVIYQVFTRLFGNTNTTNKLWGTIKENGVGKFADFTESALKEIKELGVTHIWYTGVLHHNVITDYTAYGISNDDPDVVKGRAGSPYAVKDYYNVNPDLALEPENRLEEFKDLIKRTHNIGLKVIIDIIPNHIARNYEGKTNPIGVKDFGATDNTNVVYDVNNNFYYNPKESFSVPQFKNGYLPLGGEQHPLADFEFYEKPAKWTGNGSRLSQPDFYDWYETVKVNYGIKPDGTKDFDTLPSNYKNKDAVAHFKFWENKKVPNSWNKFKDIVLYWLDLGVDGFRYDMAEMVPVEFWSYMNSAIKMKNKDAFLLAEVYTPSQYRDYIHLGKMDYLYDKVQMYDTLKSIMQGKGSVKSIAPIVESLKDIEHHMVHFLENHDEQRIASPEFLGDAEISKPGMVLSATISTSPTLIYFGQELGEPGAENAGFGTSSRTSIFDYIGVPTYQRWVNNKQFDGGQSTKKEKELRDFYKRLLNFTIGSSALMGAYKEIPIITTDSKHVFSFARWSNTEKLIIVTNFDTEKAYNLNIELPSSLLKKWSLENSDYILTNQLYKKEESILSVKENRADFKVKLKPLQSFIFKVE